MKKGMTLLLALIVMLTTAGCAGGGASEQGAADDAAPITIGIMDWAGLYPWFGIRDTGIFEEVGIDAEIKYFPKYSELISAFAAGNLDMVGLSYGDTISAMEAGLQYKFISVTDCTYGADALVVDPSVGSLEELRGKKIATELGTSDHYYLYKILEANGMTMQDIEFVNLGLNEANAAMTSGQVDAVVTLEPFLGQLLAQGYKKLTDSTEMFGIVPCSILAKDTVIASRSADCALVLKAWYMGIEKLNERDPEFIAACADGAGIETADFEMYLDIIKFFTPEEGLAAFSDETEYVNIVYNTTQWAEFFVEEGLIERVPEDIGQYLDTSVLEAYIEEN